MALSNKKLCEISLRTTGGGGVRGSSLHYGTRLKNKIETRNLVEIQAAAASILGSSYLCDTLYDWTP
jgi:hypothetical protein